MLNSIIPINSIKLEDVLLGMLIGTAMMAVIIPLAFFVSRIIKRICKLISPESVPVYNFVESDADETMMFDNGIDNGVIVEEEIIYTYNYAVHKKEGREL